jgi:hypothetical protein
MTKAFAFSFGQFVLARFAFGLSCIPTSLFRVIFTRLRLDCNEIAGSVIQTILGHSLRRFEVIFNTHEKNISPFGGRAQRGQGA